MDELAAFYFTPNEIVSLKIEWDLPHIFPSLFTHEHKRILCCFCSSAWSVLSRCGTNFFTSDHLLVITWQHKNIILLSPSLRIFSVIKQNGLRNTQSTDTHSLTYSTYTCNTVCLRELSLAYTTRQWEYSHTFPYSTNKLSIYITSIAPIMLSLSWVW